MEIINKLIHKSTWGNYIFRGEPKCYDKVSSSLYRTYPSSQYIKAIQRAELNVAKKYTFETDNSSILTELQHHGGKTNLIDFTADYLIALFFACDSSRSDDGRVILLDKSKEGANWDIYEPRNPANRVIAQKSIFVIPHKGYIGPEDTFIITIPYDIKLPILEYLGKSHGIRSETIYNDLFGFIRYRDIHQEVYQEAYESLITGDCHQGNKNYEQAIEYYTKALKLNPQLALAYHNRGNAYRQKGELDLAIADYGVAIELDPDYADVYYNRGVAYRQKGELDLAITDYGVAIELDSSYAYAYNNRGVAYREKGDFDLAVENYNKAIELDPTDAYPYYNRGNAYREKGGLDNAIADYTKAIELDPVDADAYYNRGIAFGEKSDLDKAIADYTKAIELDPDSADAYHNRGNAFRQKGDIDSADADYDKATELRLRLANVYYGTGVTWLRLSQWETAKRNLNMAKYLGMDIMAKFHNDYGSVTEFEQSNNLTLPDDIAEMLGG